MLADQFIGETNNDVGNYPGKVMKNQPSTVRNPFGSYSSQSANELGTHGPELGSLHFIRSMLIIQLKAALHPMRVL